MAWWYSQLHLRFASVSSFLESCFRSSLHDGFLQISTKSSYPISSRRRGACFTKLSQDDRGVRRAVSRTVHHRAILQHVAEAQTDNQEQALEWDSASPGQR
ncbi:hypothetical protein AVEN_72819-1 [Araneus ventricosus]|uniref:Uncharacterized protein n=1 Tax=Araneus ventricosus TaxID=182803 RepID=A0A4Y2TNC4_ARAVE|nr:hypothetical protein AVEN_72819-1 [Araneus ventricosus]